MPDMQNTSESPCTIAVFADTHGAKTGIDKDATLQAVVHLGDFSESGEDAERFFAHSDAYTIPHFFVSGNHETRQLCLDIQKRYGAAYLDYAWASVGDVLLVGLGGYDIFGQSRKQNLLRFSKRLRDEKVMEGKRFAILLTHEPPWPWKYENSIRGDLNIHELVRMFHFDLILTAHWHEEQPRLERESVIAPTLNPGMCGCLVRIDPVAKTWSHHALTEA